MHSQRAILYARRAQWSIAQHIRNNHAIQLRRFADAHPIDQIADKQLDRSLDAAQPVTSETPLPDRATSPVQTEKEERIAKAQIVFGSRLAGPAERRADLERDSINVAGVLVPPKPEEPDNCCMSGCVNCVWDRYREEFEDWAAKNTEAQGRLAQQRLTVAAAAQSDGEPAHVVVSVDDDGGGSDTKRVPDATLTAPARSDVDPFADVPVGIREFMKTEKRLKAKQAEEAANG